MNNIDKAFSFKDGLRNMAKNLVSPSEATPISAAGSPALRTVPTPPVAVPPPQSTALPATLRPGMTPVSSGPSIPHVHGAKPH
jgi:hypothetical protein